MGCGSGELSLFLARRGNDVISIDLSDRTITPTKSKAWWRRIDAVFLQIDTFSLDDLNRSFRTIVDSAKDHWFGHTKRDRSVGGLRTVLADVDRYFVLEDVTPKPESICFLSSHERQYGCGHQHWTIQSIVTTVFERRGGRNPA